MTDLVEEHRAELESLCRRYHVKALEVFGSAADGTFDPATSDMDFLVEFLPEAATRAFHGYFDLRDELERLYGRKVDLVMPDAVRSPSFRDAINQQRRPVYAA
jgi:predicted nucleotidyltransferase